MTDFEQFKEVFENSLSSGCLNRNLIYKEELQDFLNSNNYIDLLAESKITLQTRSYPYEVLSWVKETLKYLYDDSIVKVNASVKHIPKFLLK